MRKAGGGASGETAGTEVQGQEGKRQCEQRREGGGGGTAPDRTRPSSHTKGSV